MSGAREKSQAEKINDSSRQDRDAKIPQAQCYYHGCCGARENVVFADMNDDRRAEFLVSRTDESVQEWYNQGGPDDGPNAARIGWWRRGTIATGVDKNGTGVGGGICGFEQGQQGRVSRYLPGYFCG
jgi:hypothetical protein